MREEVIYRFTYFILIYCPHAGNKTYEHFNAMGIFTDKKLADLGAKRVHELGVGDDDANLEVSPTDR